MTQRAAHCLDEEITGPSAWTAASISVDDWKIAIPHDCIAELHTAVAVLRANPLPVPALRPADFDLGACRELMSEARRRLDEGVGFAVLESVPVDTFDEAECKAVYWLLSTMLSRVVAGAFDGRMLHDVADTGKKLGPRVRGDLTNQEIPWHTDNGFSCPPDYFGLLCLRGAAQGGGNQAVSLHTAHNEMRRRHPDLLPRLYEDFYWNRVGEHAADASPVNTYPYLEIDGGRLLARFNRRIVYGGYEIAGVPFDQAGQDALEAFLAILDDPALSISFTLGPGQIVYMNNRLIAHRRTPFSDSSEADRRRHLVRIYMRDHGPRHYLGDETVAST
jgi:alpha-ketoglutarate-dependent taurine dioxygenase